MTLLPNAGNPNPSSSDFVPLPAANEIHSPLIEVTRLLAQSQNLTKLLFNAVRGLQTLGFERVRLYTVSADRRFMVAMAQQGMDVDFLGRQISISGDPVLEKINGTTPIFIKERMDGVPEPYEEALAKQGVNQFLYIPLIYRQQLEGLIVADNKYSGRRISETEVRQLTLFSSQLAVALRGYFEREWRITAERKANRYSAIQSIFLAISSRSSLQEIFELTCRSAFDLFQVDHVGMVQFINGNANGRIVAEYPPLGLQGRELPSDASQFGETFFSDQQPIIIDNVPYVEGIDSLRKLWLENRIWALLIVPIVVDNEVVGSFSLDMIERKGAFAPDEIELSKIFAAQIGVAIQNSQLLSEATERSEQLASLSQTTLALTSKNDRDALLKEIVERAVTILRSRSGGIKRYYPERGYLEVITVYGRSNELLGAKVPIGVGMSGKIIEKNLPYLSTDNYDKSFAVPHETPSSVKRESMLMAPMQWQNQTIGVLYVEDELAHSFTEQEAKKLRLFADQAAIALCTADLINHNSAKADRLRRLTHAVNMTVQRSEKEPLKFRLNQLSRYAAEILNSEACGISLMSRKKTALVFEAGYGYRPDAELKQLRFPIKSEPGAGLTGHIAFSGKLFNQHGEALTNHFAVRGIRKPQTDSGVCYSLLAVPLKRRTESGDELIGLLRVENKKDENGIADPYGAFSKEDELLLQLLADAVSAVVSAERFVSDLQEKQRHYEQLIDASPAGIIFNNRAGVIEHVNQKACDLLGYRREELEGEHVRTVFSDPGEVTKINRRVARSKNNLVKEYPTYLSGKQNTTIPIKMSATRLYKKGKQIKGTIGYFEDLTEIYDTRSQTDLLLLATKTLTKNPDLDAGLDEFAKMMVMSWNAAFCRICLLDGKSEQLTLKAIQTHPDWIDDRAKRFLNTKTAVSDWPDLDVVIRKKPYHLMRQGDPRQKIALELYTQRLQYGPLHSLLVIPLKTRHFHCVGIMILGNLTAMPDPAFDEEQIRLARAIANQTAVLIERANLSKDYERRATLLGYLDDGLKTIRVTKERKVLLHEASRLAAGLSKRQIGGLFKNLPYKGELIVEAIYGLDDSLVGQTVLHTEGLIHDLIQTGELQSTNAFSQRTDQENIFRGQNLETLVLVPLKKENGEIEAVLFVADQQKPLHVDEIDLEILERFTTQVAIALQTADLLDKETKHLSHITLLHDISTQIQVEKDVEIALNLVLTGITAKYGLGFNRAAIYLHNPTNQKLEGRAAIGHRRQERNQEAWDKFDREGPHDLRSYRKQIEADGLKIMPLGQEVREDSLFVDLDGDDKFSRVFTQQKGQQIGPEDFDKLPDSFKAIFAPTTPIVILPLVVQKSLGLLIVDKKFTQDPIVDEEIELLNTFANTAAIVIENNNLLREAQSGERDLNSLYQASNRLVSALNPEGVAQSIVTLARQSTTAVSVRMILIQGRNATRQRSFLSSSAERFHIDNPVRDNGLTMKIMKTGKPQIIPDTVVIRDQVNPRFFEHGIRAAAGFPLSIENKRIGVIWFYYDKVYYFLETKIKALHFYVNQSALAYENARHIDNLEKMRFATQTISSVHSLQDVRAHILKEAKNVLQADDAAIWIYNAARKQFIISETEATFDKDDWVHFQKDEPSPNGTAYTVINKGWIGIDDVSDGRRHSYLGESTTRLLQSVGVRSFQGIHLDDGVETLGVLYANYKTRRAFSDEDIKTAKTFAHHASLALKKARLLDHQIKAQRAANIVAKLTTLKSNPIGLDNTLDMVAEGTMEALYCDAVTIYVYEQARRKVHRPPTARGLTYPTRIDQEPSLPSYSLVRKMLKLTEMHLVDSVENDYHFRKSRFSNEEKIKSLAVVPLKVGSDKVGVIFVNYRSQHRFTQNDIDILSLFADQAAIAIYNAQLYEQVQKQSQTVQAMNEAVRAISTSDSLKDIFDTISEQAVRVTGVIGPKARYAHLVLVKNGKMSLSGTFPYRKKRQLEKSVEEIDLYSSKKIGITGRAILEKAPILVEDSSKHPDYLLLHPETGSELAVPIMDGEDVIGAINVEHPGHNAFDEQDIAALQVLAKHASVAIQKTAAHERETRHLNALTAIDNAVQKINQTFDLNEILNTIVEQAMQLTGISNSTTRISYIALVRGNYARFEATCPKKELPLVQKKLGNILLVGAPSHKMGIVGRTIVTKEVQLVPDVRSDPDYLPYWNHTRSELSVPILDKGEAIGAIIVDHPQVEKFDEDDIQALSILAQHAAVAIRNGRLHRDMESVAEISHDAATSLKKSALINQICQRIDTLWPEKVITNIRLYNRESNALHFVANWHKAYSDQIDDAFKQDEYKQPLDRGICGLVARTKRPYFTPDVTRTKDVPNPLRLIQSTRSEICVPILYGDEQELIGVIDIQSPEVNLFNQNDQRSLVRLAQQLAVAIRKAQDYELLEQTKGKVGASTALAWMGMASNVWRHSLVRDAGTIRELSQMLDSAIEQISLDTLSKTKIQKKLQSITKLANDILEKPITPPLKAEEGAALVLVNDFVKERTSQLWENEVYQTIDGPYLQLCNERAVVFISSEWLRLAFDLVVDNAIEAMQGRDEQRLTIFTEIVRNNVHIGFKDTGHGISEAVKKQLFTAEIETKKERGHLGRGLLMVQAIVETYGGKVFIQDTSALGTTMVLLLPLSGER